MPEHRMNRGIRMPVRRLAHKKFVTTKGHNIYNINRNGQLFDNLSHPDVTHDVTAKAAK